MNTRRFQTALPLLLVLAAGCASVQPLHSVPRPDADQRVQSCVRWLDALDTAVVRARARDAAAFALPGFGYLRVDRFHASLAAVASGNPPAFEQWAGQMRALDREARGYEIANLPQAAFAELGVDGASSALQRAEECAQQLLAADLADPETAALIAGRARVPDHYLGWRRVVGLYPIVRLPFHGGVQRWQREAAEAFRNARSAQPPAVEVSRYVPPASAAYSRAEVAVLLARAEADPLGTPRFSPEERARLFATFAPVIEVETTGDYDRIGALRWAASPAPEVDPAVPIVYRKLAYTRAGGRTLVQLVYVAWVPERPKRHAFDLLGGRLDGLVWRVTLAPDGEPVLFDSIHPCGCFHMFFPTPRAQPLPAPGKLIEWAFVPAELPALPEGGKLVVRAQTRTHYLRDVAIDPGGGGMVYAFADYDALRALPVPGGGTRSAFAPDGLVPGTARAERFFFWPMGVASAGAMRQWGTHATAFLGRRHFDDADLIERRFNIR
jgi:hypothetical protein